MVCSTSMVWYQRIVEENQMLKKVSVLTNSIKNKHKSIFNAFDHDISLRSLVFKLEERYMLFFLAFSESYGFYWLHPRLMAFQPRLQSRTDSEAVLLFLAPISNGFWSLLFERCRYRNQYMILYIACLIICYGEKLRDISSRFLLISISRNLKKDLMKTRWKYTIDLHIWDCRLALVYVLLFVFLFQFLSFFILYRWHYNL